MFTFMEISKRRSHEYAYQEHPADCLLCQIPFYLKVQSFRLIMENNFIRMAASTGHAVPYTIVSIFKHIIDCVQLYFTNGFTNIVL